MSNDPIPVFVNPVAGRGRAAKYFASIREIFQLGSVECELIESKSRGDIEQRVFEAANSGAPGIIVAGGDGSIHEAVNGILRSDSDTALGVVPLGTGNDFAKACAIPLEWRDAATALAERIKNQIPGRRVDAARMNDRFFVNGAGIGFDAKINRIARDIRWRIGGMVYLVAVFKGIRDGILTPDVKMRFANQTWNGAITLANISNGPWVGGIFHVAPMAKNDDGHLDLVVVAPVNTARILALLPRLVKGTHINAAEVSCARIESFELTSDAPVPSHLDGEVQPLQMNFRIEILKRVLQLL